jgi:predicted glycogen debranching enzyme
VNEAVAVSRLDLNGLIQREWLVANGIGGYASSTIPCCNTRKYHGLLVAAMAPPVRRMVLLSRVQETLVGDDQRYELACNEYPGTFHPQGHQHLRAFNPHPFPRWAYQCNGWTLEKQLRLLKDENTVVLSYTLLGGERSAELELVPLFALRSIHELMYQWNGRLLAERRARQHFRIPATSRTPELFFAQTGSFDFQPDWFLNTIYRREGERGYGGLEDVWTPGIVRFTLAPGQSVYFVCSSDPIDLQRSIEKVQSQDSHTLKPLAALHRSELTVPPLPDRTLDRLVRAVDQFVISAPTDGSGEKPSDKTSLCIGHYPWGAPSARAAVIGFNGLYLVPGRFSEARAMLLSLAAKERHGLMPSGYPEDGSPPSYSGADVSLWFVNAVWQYLRYTNDQPTVRRQLLDCILRVIEFYRRGTDLGIGADESGLLFTRMLGQPTTWMDAKVGDWVITPRAGRPVEINALWYNAICIAADLCQRFGQPQRAGELAILAITIKESFNRRFWNAAAGCCFDVVEDHGHDPAVRPNQLLALSLPFPVLSLDRHAKLLEKVRDELLTPVGLRTLSPSDPAYVGVAGGSVIERERSHYNGSAHPWLLGPYITALCRVLGRGQATRDAVMEILESPLEFLSSEGLGQLCELFDGDTPHRPAGAPASAPAAAELLRCYAEDVLGMIPPLPFPDGADARQAMEMLPMKPQASPSDVSDKRPV